MSGFFVYIDLEKYFFLDKDNISNYLNLSAYFSLLIQE